jgi:hypothetical protein
VPLRLPVLPRSRCGKPYFEKKLAELGRVRRKKGEVRFLGLAKTCSRHFASMLVSHWHDQLFVFKTIFIKFVYQKHEKVIRKRHFCTFYQTMLPLHAHQHQVWKRKNSPLQRVSNAVS